MKKFLFISLLAISVLSQANTQTIGVGAYQKNTIYHSKNQVNMLPIINLEYNNFFVPLIMQLYLVNRFLYNKHLILHFLFYSQLYQIVIALKIQRTHYFFS